MWQYPGLANKPEKHGTRRDTSGNLKEQNMESRKRKIIFAILLSLFITSVIFLVLEFIQGPIHPGTCDKIARDMKSEEVEIITGRKPDNVEINRFLGGRKWLWEGRTGTLFVNFYMSDSGDLKVMNCGFLPKN
jgi:hypothetical protein